MKKDNIDKDTEIVKLIIENFNDTVKDLKKILRSYRFTIANSKVELEIIGSDTKIIIDGFELDVLHGTLMDLVKVCNEYYDKLKYQTIHDNLKSLSFEKAD